MSASLCIVNQEQQRVAVGPGNWHFISVRKVSYDIAMMQCGAAAGAAVCQQLFSCIQYGVGKLVIYN